MSFTMCKGSSVISWLVSQWCLVTSWLYLLSFLPDLCWTLVPPPFRLPESNSFSWSSNRNLRPAAAVAPLSLSSHQENRAEQGCRSGVKFYICKSCDLVLSAKAKDSYVSLDAVFWAETILSSVNRMTTDTDIDSFRRVMWPRWDCLHHASYWHRLTSLLPVRKHCNLGWLREGTYRRE